MARIGIIAAMPVEIEGFSKQLGARQTDEKGFYRLSKAEYKGNEVYLVCSGIGKVDAAAATQRLIDYCGPDYIINMGIAGGISKELKTLDIVIGTELVYHDFTPLSLLDKYYPFKSSFPCDEKLIAVAEKACLSCPETKSYRKGRIASGDCFVEDSGTKSHIRDDLGGLCCEMEGASIAHVCFLNKVPCLIIRSISDLADEGAQISYEEFEKKAAEQANRIVMFILGELK